MDNDAQAALWDEFAAALDLKPEFQPYQLDWDKLDRVQYFIDPELGSLMFSERIRDRVLGLKNAQR